ncbi:hypothetical protein [Mycobacterium sp. DL592]|uniref:hypothetical protein n=1 Tax=Mycobacterium sp. DL592 TaxID=2675524 RepID=UPI0014227A6F|nr:hypothetical protein [Mycobacterium sp. DL592]
MTVGDWISLAGVVVSAGSAVWAVMSAVRARKAEAATDGYRAAAEEHSKRAVKAAEEAAAAQQQSAAAAKRAADALEAQNRLLAEQASAAERVPWRIEHRQGATWDLWNDSATPKFHVKISGPGVSKNKTPATIARVDGRGSQPFWGNTSYGAEMRANVRWRAADDQAAPELEWSGTMPAEH